MLKNKMQYQQNRLKLYLCIAGLLIMFITETWGGNSLNPYLHTIWIAIFALILPYEGILYLISFLIPTCIFLPHFAHVLLLLFFIVVSKKFLMKKRTAVKLRVFALIACFVLWEVVAYAFYGVSSLNKVLGYVSAICIFFWLLYEENHGDYRFHLKLYVFGVFSLCVLTVVNTLIRDPEVFVSDILKGTLRLGGTAHTEFSETDVAINANSLAYYSIVAIACFLSLCKKNMYKTRIRAFFAFLQIFFIVITGMLTVSRSWLLVAAVLIFLFYIAKARANRSFNKNVFMLLVILVILIVFINSSFMDAFMLRFTSERVESAGGRTELIKEYFELYFSDIKYVLLGTGVSDYHLVLGKLESMHNATQQIIVCMGLPMAILFVYFILKPAFKKAINVSLQYWLPFISVVLFVQTIQFLNPNTLMLSYVIGVYAINWGREEKCI